METTRRPVFQKGQEDLSLSLSLSKDGYYKTPVSSTSERWAQRQFMESEVSCVELHYPLLSWRSRPIVSNWCNLQRRLRMDGLPASLPKTYREIQTSNLLTFGVLSNILLEQKQWLSINLKPTNHFFVTLESCRRFCRLSVLILTS